RRRARAAPDHHPNPEGGRHSRLLQRRTGVAEGGMARPGGPGPLGHDGGGPLRHAPPDADRRGTPGDHAAARPAADRRDRRGAAAEPTDLSGDSQMKLFMHWDMEGVSGLFSREQVWFWEEGVRQEVADEGRRLLMADVNSATAAALEAGADRVIV